MLFADVALARRIEEAECRLVLDIAEDVRNRHKDHDVLVAPVGGGAAVFVAPEAPSNKLVGLGFAGPVDEASLVAVEREFERRGARLQVELSTLADTSVGVLLTNRGYVLLGYENVLGLRIEESSLARLKGNAAPADSSIVVTRIGPEEMRTWMDVVLTGFENPDVVEGLTPHESFSREALERFFDLFAGAPGFQQFLARRDGVVAGGASLRLHGGVAQLCGAATLPAHRRRGVQSAMLHSRLSDAASAGCDIAVVTTQPGSKSQENAQRRGFELLYARAILGRFALS